MLVGVWLHNVHLKTVAFIYKLKNQNQSTKQNQQKTSTKKTKGVILEIK